MSRYQTLRVCLSIHTAFKKCVTYLAKVDFVVFSLSQRSTNHYYRDSLKMVTVKTPCGKT